MVRANGLHHVYPSSPSPLTPEECRIKAAECRDMAARTLQADHRIMLEHIAQTWERVSANMIRVH